MTEARCDHCNQPFTPREAKQRFCCRACSQEWWQAERSRALEFYRHQQREQQGQSA